MFAITLTLLCILSLGCADLLEGDIKVEKNCTCVPYYQCSEETGLVISDGAGLFDFRNHDAENNHCSGYFDVCCYLPKKEKNYTMHRETSNGCGYTKPGDFPWTVALLHQTNETSPWIYKCGASLINRRAAIGAAHCIDGTGNWALKIKNHIYPIQNQSLHPLFDEITLKNDIVVFILKTPIYLRQHIRTICIPPPGMLFDGSKCVVNVWKVDELSTVDSIIEYNVLKLPIVPRERCQKVLRTTRLGKYFELHESFICAGGEENQDTCKGHGGSALVCPVANQPNRYHQVGIVSWGIGCGVNGMPGVYVNVGLYRNWIDSVLKSYKLDITSYRY